MDDELEKIRKRKIEELQERMNRPALPNVPIVVNDSDIEQSIKNYPKLVIDCWATWCGPCRIIAPTIETLAKEKAGEVVFGKLDVDQNPRTSMKYAITAVPTLLVFRSGKLVGRVLGALPKPQLDLKLTELLK